MPKLEYPVVDTVLFFGSFDPFTLGHAAVITTVLFSLGKPEVVILPSAQDHWGKSLTSHDDRIAMIMTGIQLHPEWEDRVHISDVQLSQALSGYTIDTVRYLRDHEYNGKVLGLVLGYDAALQLPTWKEWSALISLVTLFVVPRGTKEEQPLPTELSALLGVRVFWLPADQATQEISSTRAREQIHDGVVTDTEPDVAAYAKRHALYL